MKSLSGDFLFEKFKNFCKSFFLSIEIDSLNSFEINHIFSMLYEIYCNIFIKIMKMNILKKGRPPSLSELTPIIFYVELTHLGSESSKYK